MLVCRTRVRLSAIETQGNAVDGWRSKTMRGVMDILPRKSCSIWIMKSSAIPVNLSKYRILTSASDVPKGIIDAYKENSCMMRIKSQVSRQGYIANTINAVYYIPGKHREKQVARLHFVDKSDDNLRTERQKDLAVAGDYFTYHNRFKGKLNQFNGIWS